MTLFNVALKNVVLF